MAKVTEKGSRQRATGNRQQAAVKWQKANGKSGKNVGKKRAKAPFGQGMRHGRRPRRGFPLALLKLSLARDMPGRQAAGRQAQGVKYET